MKKTLLSILILAMPLLIFTSCGAKNTKLELTLSDNLPKFTLSGNYTVDETPYDVGDDTEILWSYIGNNKKELKYTYAYKWPVTNYSLLEETKLDAKRYFPVQEPEVVLCNFWAEPGDYEYTYYTGIVEDNSFAQLWTFQDEGYFYQICAGYDLINHKVDGTNIEFSIPSYLKEVKTDTALMRFEDPEFKSGMIEFPNVEIYLNNGDFEFTLENIKEKWGVENINVEEHEFTSNDKNKKIPGYRIKSEYNENGKTYICEENLIKTGDKYFGMNFSYENTVKVPQYIENSYRSFLYTIIEN